MAIGQIKLLRLNQWACRAADHINGVIPARAEHLGNSCAYARTYMGHRCRCGEPPVSWAAVYTHVLAALEREKEATS